MFDSTFITQTCPTCGRPLHIRLDLLDEVLACEHCHAGFVAEATSPRKMFESKTAWQTPLAQRVDELLASDPVLQYEQFIQRDASVGRDLAATVE